MLERQGFRIPAALLPTTSGDSGAQAEPLCETHSYTTEIISLDPLLIYIANFTSPAERAALIRVGTPLLQPSPVTGYGAASRSEARTSHSAPLPGADPTVACVLGRAQAFLGTVLAAGRDEMGQAQMVEYTAGQKFDTHFDWFARPRILDEDAESGRRRLYNRVATFFAVLRCKNCTEGETWFPHVVPAPAIPWDGPGVEGTKGDGAQGDNRAWRLHKDGGVAFKPVPGNAVFWVNLFPNGTGDSRVLHAGRPVGQGLKTALNIWPRTFFGPDA
ncbi:hypothetical protein GQ53DRAFT_632306 [Thozetella sp. PMI_491]|nr:hypothetical protein GQ53DRAFT_632306 [Thozetella sp. PMI_491]